MAAEAMEEWVIRTLQRWPNVPALYGWLTLDRRGRWLIQGETIGRRQIVEVIDRNYASDANGCWFFQNGPQRGYMRLERAPFILHVAESNALFTHTQLPVNKITQTWMDENGGLYFLTEHGPSALLDADLDWALSRMFVGAQPVTEPQVAAALAMTSGTTTAITLRLTDTEFPIARLDNIDAPERLHFVREPSSSP